MQQLLRIEKEGAFSGLVGGSPVPSSARQDAAADSDEDEMMPSTTYVHRLGQIVWGYVVYLVGSTSAPHRPSSSSPPPSHKNFAEGACFPLRRYSCHDGGSLFPPLLLWFRGRDQQQQQQQHQRSVKDLVSGTLRWRRRLDFIISQLSQRTAGDSLDPEVLAILRIAIFEVRRRLCVGCGQGPGNRLSIGETVTSALS